jgi:hypothetical protein
LRAAYSTTVYEIDLTVCKIDLAVYKINLTVYKIDLNSKRDAMRAGCHTRISRRKE